MGWVYEIKFPEAFTLSLYFFAMIKVIPVIYNHADNMCNCFDD